MRRGFIITALFTGVIILPAIFFYKSRVPFGKSNSEFSIKPESEITKIVLSQEEQELTLERSGEEWLINGKENARKSGINFIIRILTEAKIKSPVSPDFYENEITKNDVLPVNVKVYEGRKMLKSFKVYKTGSNNYGNIMKVSERSKPFIVYVPGYEVNIGSAFTLKEHYWQSYTVFNLLPSEISSVDFENITDTSSSFSIFRKDSRYSFYGNGRELTGWDTSLVIRYLSYFTWIPFEAWAFEISDEEKIFYEQSEPLYRITLVSSGGNITILSLWTKMKLEDVENKPDTDRLYGKAQASDHFFIIRYFDIDPVLKRRSYFFPE